MITTSYFSLILPAVFGAISGVAFCGATGGTGIKSAWPPASVSASRIASCIESALSGKDRDTRAYQSDLFASDNLVRQWEEYNSLRERYCHTKEVYEAFSDSMFGYLCFVAAFTNCLTCFLFFKQGGSSTVMCFLAVAAYILPLAAFFRLSSTRFSSALHIYQYHCGSQSEYHLSESADMEQTGKFLESELERNLTFIFESEAAMKASMRYRRIYERIVCLIEGPVLLYFLLNAPVR